MTQIKRAHARFRIQRPLARWRLRPPTPKIRVCSGIFDLARPPPRPAPPPGRAQPRTAGPRPRAPEPRPDARSPASLSTCASGSIGSETREDRPQRPTSLVLSASDPLVLWPRAGGAQMCLPVSVPVPLISRSTRVLTWAEPLSVRPWERRGHQPRSCPLGPRLPREGGGATCWPPPAPLRAFPVPQLGRNDPSHVWKVNIT